MVRAFQPWPAKTRKSQMARPKSGGRRLGLRVALSLENLETRELLSANYPGFNLDSDGTLYHTAGTQRQRIDTGVHQFAVVNDTVIDLHYANNELDSLNTDGSAKLLLRTDVVSFAVAGNGDVVMLDRFGNTYEQWNLHVTRDFNPIGNGVRCIAIAGNGDVIQLTRLDTTYEHRPGSSGSDQQIGSGVQAVAIAGNGDVIQLTTNGGVTEHVPGQPSGDPLIPIGRPIGSVTAVAVAGNGDVVMLDAYGNTYEYTPRDMGIGQQTGSSVQSIAIAGNGDVIQFSVSGAVYEHTPGNVGSDLPIGSSMTAIAIAGNGDVIELNASGNDYERRPGSTGSLQPIGSSVATIAIAGNGDVIQLNTAHDVYEHSPGSSTGSDPRIGSSVATIAIAGNGDVIQLGNSGVDYEHTPGGPLDNDPIIGGNVRSIAIAGNGDVIQFSYSGATYEHTPGSRGPDSQIGSDVKSIAIAGNGDVIQLGNSGVDYEHTPGGPVGNDPIIGGSVAAIAVAGNGDVIQLGYSGATYEHTPGAGGSDPQIGSGVASIAVAGNGDVIQFGSGNVYEHTPASTGGDPQVGSSVTSYAIAGNGHLLMRNTSGAVYEQTTPRMPGATVQLGLGGLSATQWTASQPGYTGNIAVSTSICAATLTVTGLPPGLTAALVANTVVISGTPAQSGTFDHITVTWTVKNLPWATITAPYSLVINQPPSVGTLNNLAAAVGQAYTGTVSVYGGTGGYSSLAVTNLPQGLTATLSSSVITLSGTPTQSGSFNVMVSVQDSTGASANGTYTLVVRPGIARSLAVTGFPSPITAGVPGTFTVTALDGYGNVATGYTGTVRFSSSDPQAVRPGNSTLTNGTGIFTATLATPGTQTITATDVNDPSVSGTDTVVVSRPLSLGDLGVNQWTINQPGFPGRIPINGGQAPYRIVADTGLPAGLSAQVSGSAVTFGGIPIQAGIFATIAVTVQDSAGVTASGRYSLTVYLANAARARQGGRVLRGDGNVYVLGPDGQLSLHTPTQDLNFSSFFGPVQAVALRGDGNGYILTQTGQLWLNTPTQNFFFGAFFGPVQSVAVRGDGAGYVLTQNGQLWVNTPSQNVLFSTFFGTVQTVAVRSDGAGYVLTQAGQLWVNTPSQNVLFSGFFGPVQTVAVRGDGAGYILTQAGQLWVNTPSQNVFFSSFFGTVRAVVVRSDGDGYVLTQGHQLWLNTPTQNLAYSSFFGNVLVISGGIDGSGYLLTQSGSLWQNTPSQNVPVASNVQFFQLSGTGDVYYLSNGTLFQAGKGPIASHVHSFVVLPDSKIAYEGDNGSVFLNNMLIGQVSDAGVLVGASWTLQTNFSFNGLPPVSILASLPNASAVPPALLPDVAIGLSLLATDAVVAAALAGDFDAAAVYYPAAYSLAVNAAALHANPLAALTLGYWTPFSSPRTSWADAQSAVSLPGVFEGTFADFAALFGPASVS